MYEGFIFETAKLGIQVDSLVYTYASSDLEAKNSISWLLDLKYRHVFVLGYEETLEPLMNAAYELGAVGPEYLYVFPCFDVFNVQESLRARHGKQLISKASNEICPPC